MEQAAYDAPHSPADVDEWATHAFVVLGAVPGVGRVGLAVVEGGGRRLRFTATDRVSGSDLGWCHIDAYDDVPLNTAVRHGMPVIESFADLQERFPGFVAAQRGTPYVEMAAVPITAAGDVLGGYVLYFDEAQHFGRERRARLNRLGHRLGRDLRQAQLRDDRRPTVAGADDATPPDALVAVHVVPAELAAVGQARSFLHQTLAAWGVDGDAADTATLCLSELVTNAVIHSHGGCVVRVVLHDGVLTVSVRDSGVAGAVPLESAGDPLQVHGRGLQLVEALASRWGHETDPDGASVWFALAVG